MKGSTQRLTFRSLLAALAVACCFNPRPLAARVAEPSQFINLSARGSVGTGQDVLIGGFVVSGHAPKQMLIRAAGPAGPSEKKNPFFADRVR